MTYHLEELAPGVYARLGSGPVAAARADGAVEPADALEHVRLAEFEGWAGREILPGSVRRILAALDAPVGAGVA